MGNSKSKKKKESNAFRQAATAIVQEQQRRGSTPSLSPPLLPLPEPATTQQQLPPIQNSPEKPSCVSPKLQLLLSRSPTPSSQQKKSYLAKRTEERAVALAFACGLHPRLGEESPISMIGVYVVQDIVNLAFPKGRGLVVCPERSFHSTSHFKTESNGKQIFQLTDCINIISTSTPALEVGTRVFWTLEITGLAPSGSMRYFGVHNDREGFWSPFWCVNFQTGILLKDRNEVGNTEMSLNVGDKCSVLVDLTDEFDDNTTPNAKQPQKLNNNNNANDNNNGKKFGKIAFFKNYQRVAKSKWDFQDLPLSNGQLFLAVTLQRIGDSVICKDEEDFPA